MRKPSWPQVSGPLGGHASAYRKELAGLGYSPWTASAHLYLMADVSRWLDENEVAPETFTSARVNQFLASRRAAGQHRRLSPRGLIPLLGYLRAAGVLSEEAEEEPASPTDRLVKEFVGYLATERGLAPRTIVGYERVARRFLLDCAPDAPAKDWSVADLDARQVNVFLLMDTARLSVGSANNVTTALRALLRFFYVRGFTSTSLSGCVPRGGNWRDSCRAVDLTSGDVRRLLASCDRRTAIGRRDFAILTVLSRLGLRASEVVDLTLEDFGLDHRRGHDRRKGRPLRPAAATGRRGTCAGGLLPAGTASHHPSCGVSARPGALRSAVLPRDRPDRDGSLPASGPTGGAWPSTSAR